MLLCCSEPVQQEHCQGHDYIDHSKNDVVPNPLPAEAGYFAREDAGGGHEEHHQENEELRTVKHGAHAAAPEAGKIYHEQHHQQVDEV